MRIKYFFLVSIFCLQTTISDPLKREYRRRYFPTTHSGYHGYRRQGPPAGPPAAYSFQLPPGMTFPTRQPGEDPREMETPEEEEESTTWGPQPAYRENLTEQCDYIAHYCLKAYRTGKICGRTILYNYHTFESYCMMDYVNCMRQFEAWMLFHMGPCFNLTFPAQYVRPDRGGADLPGELLKNMVLDKIAALQVYKSITDDYK